MQEASKKARGSKAKLFVIATVFIVSFALLPQAFADMASSDEELKVLGVGRIQSQAYTTATVSAQERFLTDDESSAADGSAFGRLATPLQREIAVPEVVYPADMGVALSGGWQSSAASAYGVGFIGGNTADGVKLTKESMNVAVDVSMQSLLGRTIEISYGGKTIRATVDDTGPLFSAGRALDLQPGLWKAFGAKSENEWGVRVVEWRVVG